MAYSGDSVVDYKRFAIYVQQILIGEYGINAIDRHLEKAFVDSDTRILVVEAFHPAFHEAVDNLRLAPLGIFHGYRVDKQSACSARNDARLGTGIRSRRQCLAYDIYLTNPTCLTGGQQSGYLKRRIIGKTQRIRVYVGVYVGHGAVYGINHRIVASITKAEGDTVNEYHAVGERTLGHRNVITYTVPVEANERTVYASREVGVILARCGAPRYLCHGEYARIYKVFRSTRLIHVFGPHIGLRAYHMALLLGRQPLGHGVERIDLLQREIPPYGYRLNLGSALIFVDIQPLAGGHYNVVPRTGSLYATLGSAPRQYCGRRVDTALQYLVPAYYLFA